MYGLVLEGGGGKGAYHIGAVRALRELGIEIGAVAGVSVGALNGAMIVQDDIEKAYQLWYDIDPAMIINMDEALTGFQKSLNLNATFARIKKIIIQKGLDVQPLINLLRDNIDEERVRKSSIEFGMVTVDITQRAPVEIYKENIPQGKLIDYITASSSLPVFKPTVIDGKKFLDGAFYNNLPVNLVRDKGFTDIIIIRTFGIGFKKPFSTDGLNITSIEPAENLGRVMDFTAGTARKTLSLGYYDALRAFKGLKGKKYYIEPCNEDNFFINYLISLDNDKIRCLCDLFGNDRYSGKRALFEYIVPKVAEFLGMSKNATYEDIAVGLMENIAVSCGVERFKVYSLRELYREIAATNRFSYDGFLKETPGFLKNNDLLALLAKNRIIEGVAGELFNNFKSEV